MLNPTDFQSALNETKNVQLADVRTPEEFREGHLENALSIDFYGEDFEAEIANLDQEQSVFVYCRSGTRSGKTAKLLKKLGFKSIVDMDGGFVAWQEAKLTFVK